MSREGARTTTEWFTIEFYSRETVTERLALIFP
jgi:hypothetical protein